MTPEDSFETSGEIGGEIETPTKDYRISNVGSEEIRYLISTSEAWVTHTGEAYGSLNPGATVIVTVGFDDGLVDALGEGRHQASVEFANVTNGQGTATRLVELTLGGQGRVTEGLQALYNFDEGAGSFVRDVSGEGNDLDLQIDDMSGVQWLPGSLAILAPTRVASAGPATKISQACIAKNEVSVEAWIEPTNTTQDGPARIVTVSGAVFERNFSLSQGQYGDLPTDVYDVRVRTTDTDNNGIPPQDTPPGSAKTQLTHVMFTRQATGVERIYVNGALVHQAHVTGNFSNWNAGCRSRSPTRWEPIVLGSAATTSSRSTGARSPATRSHRTSTRGPRTPASAISASSRARTTTSRARSGDISILRARSTR